MLLVSRSNATITLRSTQKIGVNNQATVENGSLPGWAGASGTAAGGGVAEGDGAGEADGPVDGDASGAPDDADDTAGVGLMSALGVKSGVQAETMSMAATATASGIGS
jgi:hypothetical protein